MNIWFVIIVIAIISVALSLKSLKNISTKSESAAVKKKLQRGRVVYQDSSSASK